jgi:hypothetical protein
MEINKPRGASAPLWTPWGIQRRSERDAQKIAINRLLRQVEETHFQRPANDRDSARKPGIRAL